MGVELLDRPAPKADRRLKYGPGEFQFGELWMPAVQPGERVPVVVFLHGGWWKAEYGLEYASFLCAALKRDGVAVWSLEYRRVGNPGGGWPGTFQDVAAGFDHVKVLAGEYGLDLERVVAAGHSAGGHLAFWLAGRGRIPAGSVLREPQPQVRVRVVVALAGAVDLRMTVEMAGLFEFRSGRAATLALMGGGPREVPERYGAGDPGELLPLGVDQTLVQGTDDDQIPAAEPARWVDRGRQMGESVGLRMINGADHFDVVDPESRAWPEVRAALLLAVGRTGFRG